MFSDRIKARISALALAGAALALPAAALAGVVVKSTGPSATRYPVGTKLDDSASITLKAGDVVTVLTDTGTRIIKGAGTFRVGDRPQVAADRFASLTRKRAATRVRTGAVRGGPDETVTNPSLWYVDVTRSGTICLYDLATVRLWRSGTEGTSTYTIADHAGGAQAEVTFDDTVTIAALDPARLPITEGGQYMITAPDGATTAHVNFVALPEDFEAPDALAEALIAKGCTVQLEALASSLEASAEAAGG
jgi:expansin (peptidoglycan-binding protein)